MPKPPELPKHPKLPEVKASPPTKRNKDDDWTIKLRARRYINSQNCDIWLLKNSNGVTSCILYGQTYITSADLLGEKLGIKVDWEERPYEFVASPLTHPLPPIE